MPKCPECSSSKTWKDGLRYVQDMAIQRYLCRVCGLRFSDQKFSGKNQISEVLQTGSRQICVTLTEGAKNLVAVEQDSRTAGDQQHRGDIIAFAWHMKKKGLAEATIKQRMYRLSALVKKGAILETPDSVETILATSKWSKANKKIFVNCYQSYCTWKKIEWDKPRITVPDKEPFLPLETEVKELIAGCGKRTSTLLQMLYESGARIGEVCKLKWTDTNFKNKTVSINCPEKGSNARTLKISDVLIAMLKALPKREDNLIFNPKSRTLDSTFRRQKNRLAKQLHNPRLKQIHFHTFRHLKATMLYYETKDILHVKYTLGHKRLDSTSRYSHYQKFKADEYIVKRPDNTKDEDQLIQDGFEYVRYDEKNRVPIYRKRK